ncbi:MAG: lysylphosphatidylglycerol synthase transmembrane domain-containing protein [Chloroflexota bacterium]
MPAPSTERKSNLTAWLRREWRRVLGLGLSLLCLALAFRGISWPALTGALAVAVWQWLILAGIVVVINSLVRAFRWQVLFYPERIDLRKVWSVYMIGQMLNAILPARAGEVGRVYYIGEVKAVSRARALSTVVVEKTTDLVMLALAYVGISVWLAVSASGMPAWLQKAGGSLLPLAATALVLLLAFAFAGPHVWRLVRPVLRPLPQKWQKTIATSAPQAIGAFQLFGNGWVGVRLWGSSALIWLLMALSNYLAFRAFGLGLSPWVALMLLVVLMSGVAVPPLPGNMGVFPYLCVLVLSLFGVERELGLAYGITLQLVAYLPLIVIGLACLLWENRLLRHPAQP